MTTEEMARLLAKIQLGDNRQVTALVLQDWMETLGNLHYEDAYRAVVEHRRESTDYLMPAHITQRVRKTTPRQTPSPRVLDCGNHRRLPDGTCVNCEHRHREVEA